MGLFWEVPIMLGLVYLGKALGKRGFWKAAGELVPAEGALPGGAIPVFEEESGAE